MLRVAAIGDQISQNFTCPINRNLVVKTLLLHDMGNILKFKFTTNTMLADEDKSKVDFYKKVKKEFIKKYGTHTDKATLKILQELNVDPKVIQVCKESHGNQFDNFIKEPKWEEKVCFYSDMRVGPFGVLNLINRFDNLIKRNPKHQKYLKKLSKKSQGLEKILNQKTKIDITQISDSDIKPLIAKLKNFEIL